MLRTSMTFGALAPGEFNSGRFVAWVASGDGSFFYDQSDNAYYEYKEPTSITEVIDGSGISVTTGEGRISLDGLEPGSRITCVSAAGAVIYSGEAGGRQADLRLDGQRGIVIVSIEYGGDTYRTKVIVR